MMTQSHGGLTITHIDAAKFIDRGPGVRTIPLAGVQFGASQISAGLTELSAGQEIPLHVHNCDEFVLVLEGRASVRIGDQEYEVAAMDATQILEGFTHRFRNIGDKPLRIVWSYGDVNVQRTLVEAGITLGPLDRYPEN
jgi:quercetin dioxygenase-like cupin family protein